MKVNTDHHEPPPLTVRPDPAPPPHDQQGDMTDAQRAEAAFHGFVRDFGQEVAVHMDACIHCGACAHACHYFLETGDPEYTPIRKLDPFRKAYQREAGPFSPLFRLLGLESMPDVDELRDWQSKIYDSCNLCGRCTLICPMGIDIADLVKSARHGMFDAGLVPARLARITQNAQGGSQFGTADQFAETALEIGKAFDVEVHLDKPRADILLTTAPAELEAHHKSFADGCKIMNYLGVDWTMSREAFEATNFGFLSGDADLQRRLTTALIDKAVEIGAHTVLLPECGHAYGAARWEWASWYDREVPVTVLHMTEFLDHEVAAGRIKVKKIGQTTTFHDPCQIIRRGGLVEAPRRLLEALGLDLIELRDSREFGFCCGGGGGVLANERAAPLRARVFDLKRRQVIETGADRFVTSCGQCRMTFERGCRETGWDHPPESLMELVADNLLPPDGEPKQ